MSTTNKINECNCPNCPGETCTCGCQEVKASAPCDCGDQCECAPCTCEA